MWNERAAQALALSFALLCACHAEAQNITGYRYWFNDDASTVIEVDLTASPVVEEDLVLNSATLAAGHHLATIQFRDADGLWSAPWTGHFVQHGATVNAFEYWFNDGIDDAVTATLTPGTAPLITAPLNSGVLPVNFQTVTVRTVDAIGERSVPYTVGFVRNGGAITGYEYWIDADIAERVSNSISPNGVVDLLANLPVPATEGPHEFTIRFRDADGGWSVPLSSTFNYFLGLDEIPGVSNYLVFPNPAVDQLALRLEASQARSLDISILDATGRTVQTLNSWSVSGTAQRSWNISALARGAYQVRVADGGHQIQIPFVKQ